MEEAKKLLSFMSKIILYCVLFLSMYTGWNLYEAHRLNMPVSDTLTTCVFAFWGTEMCLLMAKKIISRKLDKREESGNGMDCK